MSVNWVCPLLLLLYTTLHWTHAWNWPTKFLCLRRECSRINPTHRNDAEKNTNHHGLGVSQSKQRTRALGVFSSGCPYPVCPVTECKPTYVIHTCAHIFLFSNSTLFFHTWIHGSSSFWRDTVWFSTKIHLDNIDIFHAAQPPRIKTTVLEKPVQHFDCIYLLVSNWLYLGFACISNVSV